MSDLADKIRELPTMPCVYGDACISREVVLGLMAAPSVEILGADFVNDVKLLDEFAYHDDECGKLTMPNPCTCGLQPIRDRIFEKLRLWHAAERQMKRGSDG